MVAGKSIVHVVIKYTALIFREVYRRKHHHLPRNLYVDSWFSYLAHGYDVYLQFVICNILNALPLLNLPPGRKR